LLISADLVGSAHWGGAGVVSVTQALGLGYRIRRDARQAGFALLVALSGGVPLYLLHVPGGAIIGGMAAAAILAFRGRVTLWPTNIYAVLAGTLGMASGASVSPDTLRQAAAWPLSILLLVVGSVFMCASGYAILRTVGRVDQRTAFFSVAPGALSTVMILAEEQRADLATVGVVQTLRMVVLVMLVPTILGSGAMAVHRTPPPVEMGDPVSWAILIAASIASIAAARRLKFPSADFLGPMIASALLHVTGVVAVTVPPIFMALAGACMGVTIGAKFAGMRLGQLGRLVVLSLVVLVVMGVIAALVGAFAGSISGVGPVAGVLAFAPGSIDVMIALALTFHAEPAYVAAHHLSRFILLLALLPVLSRLLFKAPPVVVEPEVEAHSPLEAPAPRPREPSD
jgi:membrane AbrB-like protein